MLALVAWAADTPYVLLEPVPAIGPKVTSYGDYFAGAYTTILVVAVALAVLMIVVGGIQYSASSINPGLKEEGKHKIAGAIGGLLLALFSWLILTTINPTILDNTSVGVGNGGPGPGGGGGGPGPGGGCSGNCGGPTNLTDAQGRLDLAAAGINSFDLTNCESNGFGSPCGYFQGMTNGLVDYMADVRARCPGCSMIGRDATGPGHAATSDHYKGEKIDLAPTESLNNFVKNNPTQFNKVGEVTKTIEGQTFTWPIYEDKTTGARWMFEDYPGTGKDHWDVDSKVP